MRLAKGMFGQEVSQLQVALNVRQDGEFGTQTRQAVRDWQRANGFEVTGEVNDLMWLALFPPPPPPLPAPIIEAQPEPKVESKQITEDGPKQDQAVTLEVDRILSGSSNKNPNSNTPHRR